MHFFACSSSRYKLTGGIEKLAEATKRYARFLQDLNCTGELYPGQGPTCQYNSTHNGACSPDCIKGLEEYGEYCGCSTPHTMCPNSPIHVRCCLDTCAQELKMDLGLVLDASGSIGANNYQLLRSFVIDLLRRANVGQNKTHVGIINYSTRYEILSYLNDKYNLEEKIEAVKKSTYFGRGTGTAQALQVANQVFSYKNGLRQEDEGAIPVIFVITDGVSDNRQATIAAASVLKDKDIHMISVGVGSALDLVELHAICTAPSIENYFPITDYSALDQKLNQFTSKTCSEPAPLPSNITVTFEITKDKYKFLKIKIEIVGSKIKITVKLFNGKVALFHSFNTRNPKDPAEFDRYDIDKKNFDQMALLSQSKVRSKSVQNGANEETWIIDKPITNPEFVYVGIKGLEDKNEFEVTFDDCEYVVCDKANTLSSSVHFVTIFLSILFTFLFH